jgi:hypothetical protein
MDNAIASPPRDAGATASDTARAGGVSFGRAHWPWLVAVVVIMVAFAAGGFVEHAIDQRNADRSEYQSQLRSTLSRMLAEERRQILLPVDQRSAAAFGQLANDITADTGVNDGGTLQVTSGSGTVAAPARIGYEFMVSSPYGTTVVRVAASEPTGSANSSDEEVCAVSSTLLGPARGPIDLGGGTNLPACDPHSSVFG